MNNNLVVRKLTPKIGAEITGINLSKQIYDNDYEKIDEALIKNLPRILEANPDKVGQHRNWEDKSGAWNDQYNQSHIEGKLGHYGIAEIPICN